MSPIYTPGKVVLRKTWQPMDADAAAYITAVETADGQALEEKTKIAIDNFVLGCKADGIWSAIKASCILAGARTLGGCLVPLVGTAPTNNNFVSGDYNRKTGLVGNGSTKYLNSNRNNNVDPQNNCHFSVYATSVGSTTATTKAMLGAEISGTNEKVIFAASSINSGNVSFRCQDTSTLSFGVGVRANGLVGASRSNSAGYQIRNNKTSVSITQISSIPSSQSLTVFSSFNGSSGLYHDDSRLAFYSIGESLDLARLDARVTDLINAFGAAIP